MCFYELIFWFFAFSANGNASESEQAHYMVEINVVQEAPAGPEYLSRTIDFNTGFGLTVPENNRFAVIQSEGASNNDLVCMKEFELAILLGVFTRGCTCMQNWLETRSSARLIDVVAQELGFCNEDMAMFHSTRE